MRLWGEGLWTFGREVGKMVAGMGETGEVEVRQRKTERKDSEIQKPVCQGKIRIHSLGVLGKIFH